MEKSHSERVMDLVLVVFCLGVLVALAILVAEAGWL